MFLKYQKKINNLFILSYSIIAAILFAVYTLLLKYTHFSRIGIWVVLAIIILISNLVLYVYKTNFEAISIFKIVKKENIALAKVSKGSFYIKSRDFFFRTHEIYQFPVEVYLPHGKTLNTTIYEDVYDSNFKCLPGYCYVTYSGKEDSIALIPTYMIMNTPKLKPIVRKYENKYKPKYIQVIKDKKGVKVQNFK